MSPLALVLATAALLPTAAAPRDARAAALADSAGVPRVVPLDGVVVEARAPRDVAHGAAATSADLDSLALPAGATTEDVLRRLPALLVRTNSRGEAELSARCSESRQVAVLLDGLPLTLQWDGRFDPSLLPPTALERVTYVRGLSSLLHGPNALGGVIELEAAPRPALAGGAGAGRRVALDVATGVDHVGATGTAAHATWPGRAGRSPAVRAGIGYRNAPGDPLARDVAEPLPGDDELRLNTDRRQLDGSLAARHDFAGGGWLSFTGLASDARRGIAAELDSDTPRLWRVPEARRALAVVSGGSGRRAALGGGRGELAASLGLDRGTTRIESFDDRTYRQPSGEERGEDRTLSGRVRASHTLGRDAELRVDATHAAVRHDEALIPGGEARYRQRLWSVAGELERAWPVGAGARRLETTLGAAWDRADTPESGGRPPLGARSDWGARAGVVLELDAHHALHAGASRRARFPALRELYSGALGRFEPNPALSPERLTAVEAGWTRRGAVAAQLVAFHHRLRDAVVRITTPAGRFQRVNTGGVRSTGIELALSVERGPWSAALDATVQRVRRADPGPGGLERPENVPAILAGATLAWRPAAWHLGVRARGRDAQDALDPDDGLPKSLPGAVQFDVALERTLGFRGAGTSAGAAWPHVVTLRLAVDNVADARLDDQWGLPNPGRRGRLDLVLR